MPVLRLFRARESGHPAESFEINRRRVASRETANIESFNFFVVRCILASYLVVASIKRKLDENV
jgi:hypothetical protein